ncbi:MAG TPA: adenosylcobinamide-phosphate synthase CbiB [Rhizomicrobium sp.]|nr:adenosylcobinamide-phosphate synthase CbiB [Rhizomicrobium sp.]
MVASNLTLMAAALILDALIGDPNFLYRRIPHPVAWMGTAIAVLDRLLNRDGFSPGVRIALGGIGLFTLLIVFGAGAWALDSWLVHSWAGWIALALLASTLLAQRSLYDHVHAVAVPLASGNIANAREAVSRIVGRDVTMLDESAVCRAAIESLSENLSDGVVGPLFWGWLLGFPGLVLYKVINTADSMIGHRTPRHRQFGRIAARLDDAVNLMPARLTALLIALATFSGNALAVMIADARKHRSPNAGWPEAAMAGVLDIRLSGPRSYHGSVVDEPWVNDRGHMPDTADLETALQIMVRICAILLVITLLAAVYFILSGSPATTNST